MKTLNLLSIFFIMLFSVNASASLIKFNVPAVEITGLENYKGKNISIFYVAGRNPSFGTNSDKINVLQIFSSPQTFKIDGDSLNLKKVEIKRKGIYLLNYVLIVIHNQPNHFIKNVNSDEPVEDPRFSDPSELSESDFDSITFKQAKVAGLYSDVEDEKVLVSFD